MFTGLVEEIGIVDAVESLDNARRFTIRADRTLDGLQIGDSVAIDGACHTVVAFEPGAFVVQSVETTLRRTIFGEYDSGRRVNLERAVALGTRLGGHLVQGHVDGVGTVTRIAPSGEHVRIDFTVPAHVGEVTILHGSITVNGVSLTVNELPDLSIVQVSIIPHTWQVTALSDLREGSSINIEGDMIGKYVRHLLRGPSRGSSIQPDGMDPGTSQGY